MHRGAVIAVAALAAFATSAGAQSFDPSRRFDRLDRDSRQLLQAFRCAGMTARIRSSGALGQPEALGDRGACLIMKGTLFGVILTADTALTGVTRFNVVDFATRQLHRGPVDTAAVLDLLRAQDAATERGYEAYEKAQRQFTPLAFRTDGDSIWAWLIPILPSPLPMIGGERGALYSPNGRTRVRESDAFASYRPLAVPDTGTVVIVSSADSFPTMTEMMAANALNEAGRTVRIETKARSSTLSGRGASAIWVHVRKP